MRQHEFMTIFPLDEDKYKSALEDTKKVLAQFGAEILSEEPYGDRDLTYTVKKQNKGKFLLLNINANPAKVVEIDEQFKLIDNLLKYLFVRVEE